MLKVNEGRGDDVRMKTLLLLLALVVALSAVVTVGRWLPRQEEGGVSEPKQSTVPLLQPQMRGDNSAIDTDTTDDVRNRADQADQSEMPDRRGLHITASELEIWRKRARYGPYRIQGDADFTNSPGDWTRIVEYKNLRLNRDVRTWSGPTENPGWPGCIIADPSGVGGGVNEEQRKHVPGQYSVAYNRDAAFYAMVMEDAEDAQRAALAAKAELLEQVQEPGTDFTDRALYCLGFNEDELKGDNLPLYPIANWLVKHLFTYEYLLVYDPDLFTDAERREVDTWFLGAGEWFLETALGQYESMFRDRLQGDYKPSAEATDEEKWKATLYRAADGDIGPTAVTIHRRFNNRVACTERLLALVGLRYGHDGMQAEAKRFVKEYLRYGYFPDGSISEFERASLNKPSHGVKYGWETVGTLGDIADAFARAGDASLYEYATTDGAFGTEGSREGEPKSLETLVIDMYRYVTGDVERFPVESDLRDLRYRMDTVDEVWGRKWIHDGMMQHTNRYLRNDWIEKAYTRRLEGAPPYPENPSESQGDPQGGAWGVYPGIGFMFGQLEDAPSPYPGR